MMPFLIFLNFGFCQDYAGAHKNTGPVDVLLEKAVAFYQEDISQHSIKRCPFTVSCSNYFITEVKNKGLLRGFANFIDRYFYRENRFLNNKYKTIIQNRVLFDDTLSQKYIDYLYSD